MLVITAPTTAATTVLSFCLFIFLFQSLQVGWATQQKIFRDNLWPPCIAGCGHIYFHPVVPSFFLLFYFLA